MMTHSPVSPYPCLACVLALLATAPAWAQEASDGRGAAASRGWQCALCPQPGGWSGEADVGAGWVSDDSLAFGDYRGLEDEGVYAALDGDARYRGPDGRFFDLRMRDLGIDSRSLDMLGGRRGRYTLQLAYREIPKYRGFGAETIYRGVGGPELFLPVGWQPAPITSGMSALDAALVPTDLELRRKTLELGLRWRLASRWSWDLALQHQRKDGTRPFGAGVFTIHASHLPAPVDFTTDRYGLGLNFTGEQASARIDFAGADFDNGAPSITWPNPFTAVPGTEVLRASLEPDHNWHRFGLAGAWAPSPRLRFSGTASLGRMEQDDPLLPWSTNPEFSDLPLPRPTADARIDTTQLNLAGQLVARLTPRLDLTAHLRRDERDNQTPVDLWAPVITDLLQREPRPNRPYSFERDRASLALRYRAHRALRLQAGADFEDYERSLQSVAATEETGYWGEVGLAPGAPIELRVRLERSERDAGPYLQVDTFGLVEHPLMRKFNLADRDRDRLRIDLDLFATAALTLNLYYRDSEDRYDRSVLGLQDGDERSIGLDLGWSATDRVYAHAFVSRDDIDARLAGAESDLATPWQADTEDAFLTAGLGVQVRIGPRLDLGFDLVNAESDGDIRVTDGGAGGPFPTLETDLWNARLHLDYRVTAQWGLKAYLEHESYDSSDWALDGYGPDGIPAVLSFGPDSPDYDVTVLQLQASYRF
jgi:MtrB/PioB family decaheme-associated outer membrane protein